MVSIKDVALKAGVSNKTVSRVVNKEPSVKPKTVARVLAAIEELGYVPNLGARMVRTNRSRTFGVITDFVSTTPYSGDIIRGIQSWASRNGRTVLVANTQGDLDEEQAAWRTFQEHRIDGVFYVTMYHREVDLRQADLPIASVLVNCRSISDPDLPSVTPDDYSGSYRLTEHLLDQGHRDIAYVQLNPDLLGAQDRLRAFEDAMRAHGLSLPGGRVRVGMRGPVGGEENFVYDEVLDLLDTPRRPTAIIAGNDEMALRVYMAIMGRGLTIPEDVSVVGFDDFRTVSLALTPQLTTAALPYYELGFQAATMLDAIVNGEPIGETKTRLPCPIVARGSTRSPR